LGRVLVFVSACGGQGRTSAALAAAQSLSAGGSRVLLMDGCADGALTSMVADGSSMLYDFGDAARRFNSAPFLGGMSEDGAVCELDDACYPCEGFDFIPCPADDSGVGAQSICSLLEAARERYDWCILDAPHRSFSDTAYFCTEADVTVICTEAAEQKLTAAGKLRRLLAEEDERCRLVVTRYRSADVRGGRLCSLDHCIDTVGARLLGVIPEGDRPVIKAAADNIAARLCGRRVRLMKL